MRIFGGMVLSAIQGRFLPVGQLFCALALTVLPSFLARKFNWQAGPLPAGGQRLLCFCVSSGHLSGHLRDFPWWDDFLHFCSGALFCIAGIIVVNTVLSAGRLPCPSPLSCCLASALP